MMKGGHGQTNQLHDIDWGALDPASRAPQLMSCNYYVFYSMQNESTVENQPIYEGIVNYII